MKFINIMLQDFKLLIRDKNTFLILILMPTILVLILGTVFKSTFSMSVEQLNVAFINEDIGVSYVVQGYEAGEILRSVCTLAGVGVVLLVVCIILAERKGWKDGSILRNSKTSTETTV